MNTEKNSEVKQIPHRAGDIRNPNIDVNHQMDTPLNLIYGWIKNENWSYRDFNNWCKLVRLI